MGKDDVEFNGVHIETKVVGHSSLVPQALTELKAAIPTTRLVGIDAVGQQSNQFLLRPEILVLQASRTCVILKMDQIAEQSCQKVLHDFLGDKTITFVGRFEKRYQCYFGSGIRYQYIPKVGIGELAARVLKKQGLLESNNLEEIARAIGQGVEVPVCSQASGINYKAKVFSDVEVKQLVRDAYACFTMGSKLIAMLAITDYYCC